MKTLLCRFQFHRVGYALLMGILLLTACKNKTNQIITTEDAIAYAIPLGNMTVDGDLSDWPRDMVKYPIENVELGNAPENNEDFQGSFRIGYNAPLSEIYVAMEMGKPLSGRCGWAGKWVKPYPRSMENKRI